MVVRSGVREDNQMSMAAGGGRFTPDKGEAEGRIRWEDVPALTIRASTGLMGTLRSQS